MPQLVGERNVEVERADAKKAKVAYESQRKYADQLLQKQKLGQVDAISGATINYDQFVEAVKKDLEQANQ